MGGGTGIITESAVTDAPVDAPVSELLAAARALLVAAYGKVTAGDDRLSQDDLVGDAVAAQQVQNCAWAIQSRRLAHAAAISERGRDSGADPADLEHEWFPLEVGARFGWSDRQAGARLDLASEAVNAAPGLLDLAGQGNLDPRKVTAVASVTTGAPAPIATEVEARILDGDPVATTSAKLAAKARRLLAKLAPVAADEASQDRRRGYVGVFVTPHHEPGLSEVTAVLPTLDAATLMAVIDEHARQLQAVTTTGKTLAQSRVDALTDLALNGAIVDTQLTLLIPLADPAAPAAAPQPQQEQIAAEPVRELVGASVGGGAGVSGGGAPSPPPVASGRAGWIFEDWSQTPDPAEVEARWAALDQLDDQLDEQLRDLLDTEDNPPPDASPPPDTGTPDTGSPGTGALEPGALETGAQSTRAPSTRRRGVTSTPAAFEDVLLPRVGVIPGAAIEELIHVLGIQLSRALANPLTGVIAETGDTTYRPGAGLARFVRARDQHCRFPGCTHPAERCDLDHVIRYPDGPTAARNLQPLCRHHHRAKHEGGWKVTMTPEGVCTWTSPTGRIYITRPAD